jgi:hypothetical protein
MRFRLPLRLACLLAFSLWMGGFTFYSAIVIPVLHRALGSAEAGAVTAEVTNVLNVIGGVTLALWWAMAWNERIRLTRRSRWVQRAALILATALLVTLASLHVRMDHQLASNGLAGFYPLHRAYLIVSTALWAVSICLLAVTVAGWERE